MAGIINKLKNTISHETDSTPSHTSAGDRSTTATGTTPSHSAAGDRTGLAETNAERTFTGSDSAKVGATSTPTSATTQNTATGLEGKAERGVEHIREHAHPPAHHHNQPREDALVSETEAKRATHDHQHLAPVTHETRHHHEVEEVERQREVDRHVHHIQHHTQPVLDSEHSAEQIHQQIHPVTKVHETHASTDKDAALLTSVAGKHTDTYAEAPVHRQVVDKGERVKEQIHHHIHNVVQPIIEKDTHEYHRIQTTIPTHVVTHEAPIVHESTHHKPLSKDEFLRGGGNLSNSIRSVHETKLLNTGKCDRKVDGIAEKLERDLGIKQTVTPVVSAANAPTAGNTTTGIHGNGILGNKTTSTTTAV